MNAELSLIADFLTIIATGIFLVAAFISVKRIDELRDRMNDARRRFIDGQLRHTEFLRLKTDILNRRDELQITGMLSFLAAMVCALFAIIL